jgi:two-component system response regulator RegA
LIGLLVDDDIVFSDLLRRALEKRGLQVKVAHNYKDAIAIAKTCSPAFAVVDLKLGVESGLDLVAPLRSIRVDMQIILLTGYASVATAVDAIKRGADNYLPKPVTVNALLLAIQGRPLRVEEGANKMIPLDRLEWEHIQQALKDCDGNVSASARLLGMHRRSLQRKLSKRPRLGQAIVDN